MRLAISAAKCAENEDGGEEHVLPPDHERKRTLISWMHWNGRINRMCAAAKWRNTLSSQGAIKLKQLAQEHRICSNSDLGRVSYFFNPSSPLLLIFQPTWTNYEELCMQGAKIFLEFVYSDAYLRKNYSF
jgi:hypothetical protein